MEVMDDRVLFSTAFQSPDGSRQASVDYRFGSTCSPSAPLNCVIRYTMFHNVKGITRYLDVYENLKDGPISQIPILKIYSNRLLQYEGGSRVPNFLSQDETRHIPCNLRMKQFELDRPLWEYPYRL